MSKSLLFTLLVAAISIIILFPGSLYEHLHTSYEQISSIYQATRLASNAPSHSYTIHLFSKDPLVIYISSFVSKQEAAHLIGLSKENFKPSEIWSNDGNTGTIKASIRDSHWATPRSDKIVRAVEDRASAFQGFGLAGELEPLKVLKYEVGGHYNHHHDSFPDKTARESMEGNRESTFFVFLEADCTGGGTNFPRLKPPEDERWCQYIDCDEPYDAGVTFKPITGNAVFWQNLYSNGSVHPDLIHAGLPVTSGLKIGLNVWTWTP